MPWCLSPTSTFYSCKNHSDDTTSTSLEFSHTKKNDSLNFVSNVARPQRARSLVTKYTSDVSEKVHWASGRHHLAFRTLQNDYERVRDRTTITMCKMVNNASELYSSHIHFHFN